MAFFRVFHIPDFPASITNYTFDGSIFIPVDFKDYRERAEDTVVLLNGEPISDSVFTSLYYNGQTNWEMGIYFELFLSGTYQFQLQSTGRLDDEVGDPLPHHLGRVKVVDGAEFWSRNSVVFAAQESE